MFWDIYNLKYSSFFTNKNHYQSTATHSCIVLLFRLFWKHSLDMADPKSDFKAQQASLTTTVSNFLTNERIGQLLAQELEQLDQTLKSHSLALSGFLPLTPACQKGQVDHNLTVLLLALFVIYSIYLKENFTGPGYLAFRAQTEFKKTYKINHFQKYAHELNQDVLDAFQHEVTRHIPSIRFDRDFRIEPLPAEPALVEDPNLLAWTFEKFKTKSNLKFRSERFDEWFLVDGEQYQKPTKLLHSFKVLQVVFDQLALAPNLDPVFGFYVDLQRARLANNFSKIMHFPTESLKARLNELYPRVLESCRQSEGESRWLG